jgi:carboxylesterase
MFEWMILSAGLVGLIAILMRRGADRLTQRWVLVTFMFYGALLGILLEAMPLSTVRAPFSLRTFVATLAGVFGLRLIARGVVGWAAGYRDEDRGANRDEARLLHPLLALGLAVSGLLVLHESAAARHMALEVEHTPRNAETGIVRGAEAVALDTEGATRAVLLLHGFLGSPADLGELPEALQEAGFTVRAPLLPGHGTVPRDLQETSVESRLEAALASYDELAAGHEHVDVLGFSMGGLLAAQIAGRRDVRSLILVNPFVGETGSGPSWNPFDTDDLIEFVAPLVDSVMRADMFVNMRDRAAVARLRAYHTVPLAAVKALRDYALAAREEGVYRTLTAPTLLLLSTNDHVTPSADAHHVLEAMAERDDAPHFEEAAFGNSDHVLLLDYDKEAAIERIVGWLGRAD